MLANRFPRWSVIEALGVLAIVFFLAHAFGLAAGPLLQNLSAEAGLRWRFLAGTLLQSTLFLALISFVTVKKYGHGMASLGLFWQGGGSVWVWGIAGGLVLFVLILLVGALVIYLTDLKPGLQPFAQMIVNIKQPQELMMPLAVGAVLAPFTEELYFRGFLYPALKKTMGTFLAIIVSGSIFGALHFDLIRFLPLAVGGMGLAWLYERKKTLLVPILSHSVWNALMIIILYLNR